MRRGAILCSVLAGHLVILMLVLHPSWRSTGHTASRQDIHVLRLTFDPWRKVFPPSPVHAAARMPARTKPARSTITSPELTPAAVTYPADSPLPTASALIIAAPPASDDVNRGYQPGDFQAALQGAQRATADHIPGDVTPRIAGIRFQASSSIKATMQGLIDENRCANMQFQLQNSTRQLTPDIIDHMLETEGCGPHLEHAAADATIDALAHHATSGN